MYIETKIGILRHVDAGLKQRELPKIILDIPGGGERGHQIDRLSYNSILLKIIQIF